MDVLNNRHNSNTMLITLFLLINIFISAAQAEFNFDELSDFQECGDNSTQVIICSERCGGCKLETGRPVFCDFVEKNEFLILRGVLRESERTFDILYYIRVGCFHDDPNTRNSGYTCPQTPGVRETKGKRRCDLSKEAHEKRKSISSNRISSRITALPKLTFREKKQKAEINNVSKRFEQERSDLIKSVYRVLSGSSENKRILTSKRTQASTEDLYKPKSIFKDFLIHNNIMESSELSRFENHPRHGQNMGYTTTNAGVSVRSNIMICVPKPS